MGRAQRPPAADVAEEERIETGGPLSSAVTSLQQTLGGTRGRIALAALRNGIALAGLGYGVWEFAVFRPHGITVTDPAGYLRAGAALLHGGQVYVGQIGDPLAVSYAPPWIIAFAALSILPPMSVQILFTAANLAALWYVTGSWRGVGYAMFWPWTVTSVLSGNIDLPIAAAIVAAWRTGTTWPLVMSGLAKLGPFLAVPPRRWRDSGIALLIAVTITLPWWSLWPQWIAYLLRQPVSVPTGIGIAWQVRLPVALALLAFVRRPWAAAAAVVIGMPSLYWPTSMEGFAVVRLWLDGRQASRRDREGAVRKPAGGT